MRNLVANTADLVHAAADELLTRLPGGTVPDRTPVDSGQLWKWVDRLTVERRHRIVRRTPGQEPRIEHVDIPSLWEQLVDAQASSNTGGGRGKARPGSRAPLDLTITALLGEMTSLVVDALVSHGQKLRWRPAGTLGVRLLDTRSSLRQLAATVVGTRDQDLVDWWTDRYRLWVHQAETALATDGDDSVDLHPVRGHACPACKALWVTTEQPCEISPRHPDGVETFREPALVIAFRESRVLHITCGACGAGWWRGDDVDKLTREIAADTAVKGDARLWGLTVPRRREGAV